MAQLYLIRKAFATYLGPYTLQEVENAFKHLEFVLSDEISGSLGPWVTIEQQRRLQKYYPAVARIIYREFGSSDDIGEITEKNEIKPPEKESPRNDVTLDLTLKPTRSKDLDSSQVSSGWFSKSVIVIFLVLLTLAVTYTFRWSLWLALPANQIRLQQQFEKFERGSNFDITLNFVKDNIAPLTVLSRKDNSLALRLQPYFRSIAWNSNGEIPGLDIDLIAGQPQVDLPNDCSQAAWSDYFEQWQNFGFSPDKLADLLKKPYVRLVFLERGWIDRRSDRSWIEPQNYYQFCAKMALAAFEQVYKDGSPRLQGDPNLSALGARLRHLNHTRSNNNENLSHPLSYLNCLENSVNLSAINGCLARFKLSTRWQNLLLTRQVLAMITISYTASQVRDREEIGLLLMGMELPNVEPLVSMDLTPEANLLALLKNGSKLGVAGAAIESNYPNIRFH